MKNLFFALAAVLTFAGAARASDQVGVYAKVTKVEYSPNATEPTSVKIYGTFAFADVSGSMYQPAQVGYLYYSVPAGKEALARAEWADMKNLAGAAQCVGFGQRRQFNGTPHRLATRARPETYPVASGLAKISPTHPECKALEAAK